MKQLAVCLAFALLCMCLQSAVVINEVCYDPTGNDDGWEWIELYNNGTANEQLEGALILYAGQSWTKLYALPAFILRPGRFLLIGGSQVPNSQLTCNFIFQNGGSETDGIRYQSADGSYTDTVLYDSPNLYQLTGDNGVPGISFAPDVPAGYSLARTLDGVDSNNSAADFIAEANPTPGYANRISCDYALLHPSLSYDSGLATLDLWIKNLSTLTPLATATLTITQDELNLWETTINPIPAHDSLAINAIFSCEASSININLSLSSDPDSTNNSLALPIGDNPTLDAYINEYLANPDTGNQEWVELYLSVSTIPASYSIKDSSGSKIRFSLPSGSGYYAICQTPDNLLARYPDCPPTAVIAATAWTNLNNDGDYLVLEREGTTLDSLSYTEAEVVKGISRERYMDNGSTFWRSSLSPSGGTPGQANSIPPATPIPETGKVQLNGSPCKTSLGESISIAYHLSHPTNRISCSIFDLRGTKIRTLADYTPSSETGVLFWDGRQQNGSYAPRGLYTILWESQASDGGKIMRKQLTAVIYN